MVRTICTIGCHGSAWNTASRMRTNTRIAIAIAMSTTNCFDEQLDRLDGIGGDPEDEVLQDLRDEVDDDDREDRGEVDPAEIGRILRNGARMGSTMMRSHRTTGCHGLSPIHDTAMRAMMSTVKASAMKPIRL